MRPWSWIDESKKTVPLRKRLRTCQPVRAAGGLEDVVLRVTAIDTQRVQFEQFTPVVFVGDIFWRCAAILIAVQVDEHCWRSCRGADQVAEFAERVTAGSLRGHRRA